MQRFVSLSRSESTHAICVNARNGAFGTASDDERPGESGPRFRLTPSSLRAFNIVILFRFMGTCRNFYKYRCGMIE